jgi:hypothetical protein
MKIILFFASSIIKQHFFKIILLISSKILVGLNLSNFPLNEYNQLSKRQNLEESLKIILNGEKNIFLVLMNFRMTFQVCKMRKSLATFIT